MKKKTKLIALLILCLAWGVGWGQLSATEIENTTGKIRLGVDTGGYYIHDVQFWDVESGAMFKKIDLDKENPFFNLQYPVLETAWTGLPTRYTLIDEDPKEAAQRFGLDTIKGLFPMLEPVECYPYVTVCVDNDAHVSIIYYASFLLKGAGRIGRAYQSFLYVYNYKGELIYKDINHDPITKVAVSGDGKRMAYYYGYSDPDMPNEFYPNEKMLFIDIPNRKTLIDFSSADVQGSDVSSISVPVTIGKDLLFIYSVVSDTVNGDNYFYYSTEYARWYSQFYTIEKLNTLQSIENGIFTFKDGTSYNVIEDWQPINLKTNKD